MLPCGQAPERNHLARRIVRQHRQALAVTEVFGGARTCCFARWGVMLPRRASTGAQPSGARVVRQYRQAMAVTEVFGGV